MNRIPVPRFIKFKNANHIFQANITPDSYGYSIRFGGHYDKCITISITVVDGVPLYGTISHIQSEQECTLDTLLLHEESTNFVKACLQLCSITFPGLTRFVFDDMSNIECNPSSEQNSRPPRKLKKPFSLAPLHIAVYGQTWYESKFGAKLENTELYTAYRKSVEILYKPKQMEYSHFKQINKLTPGQEAILEPLYTSHESWNSFFKSIPRFQRCDAMYNWLPTFITRSLNIKFVNSNWTIDITKMEQIPIEIIPARALSEGGTRSRHALASNKTRRRYRLFTNQMEGWKIFA